VETYLNEQALYHSRTTTKFGPNGENIRHHRTHDATGGNASKDLRYDDQKSTRVSRCTHDHHAERDSRVEQASTDAEEHPRIHSQTHTKHERDIHDLARIGAQVNCILSFGWCSVDDICPA
jgi:hypothetical protein